jgi:hypothetical protein
MAIRSFGNTFARMLAPQDVVVVAFELYLWLRALLTPMGPGVVYARNVSFGLLATTLVVLALTRGELLPRSLLRAALYRLGLFVPMVCVYLALRRYLPALDAPLLDAELLALDRALLGETPAVVLERFATPGSVEWFSFCYSSYFTLLAVHVGRALLDHGRRATELLLGMAIVTALGQSLYTVVPALGPYATTALFARSLPGRFLFAAMREVVDQAGAMLDIFPSLHTAHPVLIALHALRHRATPFYRTLWLPTLLLAANMVVSTMFLRWHYGVDVLAGLALAGAAHVIAVRGAGEDRSGRQPCWEPLSAENPLPAGSLSA